MAGDGVIRHHEMSEGKASNDKFYKVYVPCISILTGSIFIGSIMYNLQNYSNANAMQIDGNIEKTNENELDIANEELYVVFSDLDNVEICYRKYNDSTQTFEYYTVKNNVKINFYESDNFKVVKLNDFYGEDVNLDKMNTSNEESKKLVK